MLPSYVHSQHLQCYNCNIIVKNLVNITEFIRNRRSSLLVFEHTLCKYTKSVNLTSKKRKKINTLFFVEISRWSSG